ncbi:MAG TPA: bifunctional diguanylate cyclase/phosphodiesterase [Mariprofundaceae bacterium]|nr:bifunctional diguanylate cyclase/phosphodiesterase [Mariprofundaceae bacterium]
MLEIGENRVKRNSRMMAVHIEEQSDSNLSELKHIIKNKQITPFYQPLIDLRTNHVFGYESLARAPKTSPLHMPDQLFGVAREHQMLFETERVCRERAIQHFSEQNLRGKLFLNVDPYCLMDPTFREGTTLGMLERAHIKGSRVVIELTEHSPVDDITELKKAVRHYREMGFSIALDDLSAGYSNLQLMAELRPEYIKLDKYFIRKLPDNRVAQEFVRTIVNLAKHIDCTIIAEGIETDEILCETRKLGIHLGQGYLIGRPEARPDDIPVREVGEPLCTHGQTSHCAGEACITNLIHKTPPCNPGDPSEQVLSRFQKDARLLALPVVEKRRTVGMVLREDILMHFSLPFTRELHGKRPIRQIMQRNPLIVPASTPIEELSELTTNRPFKNLYSPIIVDKENEYSGLIFVHDLLERITRMKVDLAMESNPLTRLPGNTAIEKEVTRRLQGTSPFILSYFDIDHFKAFNDHYGYKRGDAMIGLLANVLKESKSGSCFIGHIGGDDFIMMCEKQDGWEARIRHLMETFSGRAKELYDEEDIKAGGITTKNRAGELCCFPVVSLSIGALPCLPECFSSHLEAAEIAVEMKRKAKKTIGNRLEIDRRSHTPKKALPETA